MSPHAPQPNSNLLSPQKHINSDWVIVYQTRLNHSQHKQGEKTTFFSFTVVISQRFSIMKHPYRWQKPNVQLFTDTFSCSSTIHLSVVEKKKKETIVK